MTPETKRGPQRQLRNPSELEIILEPFPNRPEFNPQGEYGLALQQFDWGHPTEAETSWLVRQGVFFEALLKPWPIGATNAEITGTSFAHVDAGERVLTFVCFDRGVPNDVVAWQPRTGKVSSYSGRAFCLGDADDIFNPATLFDGGCLHISASPLEWLQSGRNGIVIVKPKLAHAYLGHLPSVFCSSSDHARKVRRWVRAPKHNPKIFTAKEVA
jgi:hypothetical protein